jgi:signal transduction histidine kinase/CheY-like chemotaxis protein/CHASE3 domain sensor protein
MTSLKNIKISTQLKLGFAALLFLVIVLGVVSYQQTAKIHQQTETMFNHPLKTRRMLEKITSNVLFMRMNIRDFLLVGDAEARKNILDDIAVNQANVLNEIESLKECYLGPREDIDSLANEFTRWVSIRQESIRMVTVGKLEEARNRHVPGGIAPKQAKNVLGALDKISAFALNKGDQLYANSVALNNSLNRQLLLLVAGILLLALLISYVLQRNIRNPLTELNDVAKRFHEGDMNARSANIANNEFGVLAASFNTLVENIQVKTGLDEKFASLAALMLSEYDINKFFQATLHALAAHSDSQMAAVYLLSDDKKIFEHFASIGVDDKARQSFAADRYEGEFGAVLASRQLQHIKNIPEDTRFVFLAVSGKFIPREIITLPIIADNKVVAIISLANVSNYSQQSLQLFERILVTLCARVEGILAYHKMKDFSRKLEQQNRELETQKTELSRQAAELSEQNTELEMQKKELGEASRLKTNFLANMSHELRTPLNSVIALSGVLNRRLAKKIPAEEYSYLEVIERNGKLLLELINDILDISRIEAGREEIDSSEFSAKNLIAEVISMILPQARQKKIALLQAAGVADLFISSDAGKCRHILQNLIGNAVKFTEKGKVEVAARPSDNNLAITVSDTGIGIAADQIPHIFDEFRQADGSTSRRYGGTGLGLAIANKYANLLGGNITVQSAPGQGSEFTLTLPMRHAAENRQRAAEAPMASKQTAAKKVLGSAVKTILLVEDSEPAIIQIKDFMEESGYHILVARDGNEALGIIAQTIPAAMILDLMMPGIDGFQVLKAIREAEHTAHIPVLILTAKHISKEELGFLKQNNVHQLIRKGNVNRSELLAAVATMVFPETAATAKPQRPLPTIVGKPLVLVVEDNPDSMLTARALLADDFMVIEAVDGKQSVEIARKHQPNLILMDIALPAMDGIEAFKAIRKLPKLQHIPVIALTASAMTADRETILAHGFDAYIAKPIDEQVFFKTIKETLYGK